MRIVLFNILFYIAAFVFLVSAIFFLAGCAVIISNRRGKKYTQKGTATLIQVTKANARDGEQWFEIAYRCNGAGYQVRVPQKHVGEDFSTITLPGTRLPIWYDPKNPERVIIAEAPSMKKNVQSWNRALKTCLILMLISGILTAYALPRTEGQMNPMTTTIGAFSDEIKALADKTPTALVYTESDGAPETFTASVDDPATVKKALNIILSAAVDRRGCYIDMYRLEDEEYCFAFGEETYTFSFVPNSYFYYDGQYYELRENRLDEVRDLLHELTTATETAMGPRSEWYGDGAVLETKLMDNGDEARSLMELTLSVGEETLTGAIEGAYDVLSIDRQPDGYVICYTYGDFYSHEAVRSSRVTVENGEMIITDMGAEEQAIQ